MTDDGYIAAVGEAERTLLRFLGTFEAIQNEMRVERLPGFQDQLREIVPDGFTDLIGTLTQSVPSGGGRQAHDALVAGLRHCGNACATFLAANERNYSLTAMDVRRSLCRGLHVLYRIREHTPTLAEYWRLPDDPAEPVPPGMPSSADGAATGVMHRRREPPLADYSLYVPEGYTPDRQWPLIVCLHGAGGRGDHHVWSWLRPARSRGYMVLAPKSLAVTWSILQPPLDTRSVVGMLDEVCEEYAVDRSRVFLTGLSDGGTFTYLLGLGRPDLFAGIAPVAGDLHGMMDDMLRRKQGVELPIYIVHGAQDHIFPVATIRSGHALLTRLGYNATYEELPEWGHSYCSFVNERLVMPWFEGLSNV